MKQNVPSTSGRQAHVFPEAHPGETKGVKLDFEESVARRQYYKVIPHMAYNSNSNQGLDQAL